jgi:xanthine dehydrogenase iron-sulfur cluster and FAD-binding subunit A
MAQRLTPPLVDLSMSQLIGFGLATPASGLAWVSLKVERDDRRPVKTRMACVLCKCTSYECIIVAEVTDLADRKQRTAVFRLFTRRGVESSASVQEDW